jgi:hypothetical protein
MSLSSSDAARVLRFCLVADDAGTVEERGDGACVVTIVTSRPSYQVHSFEEMTFESALRSAVAGGVLRAACVEKQIAFTTRQDPRSDVSFVHATARSGAGDSKLGGAGALPFLAMTDAVGTLLHETQRERGLSTLFVSSGGQLLGDELTAQWQRTDRQRTALFDVIGPDLGGLPPAVQRRFQHVTGLLGAINGTRDAVMSASVDVDRVIEVYSALNTALLSAVEAYMVTSVVGGARNDALSCVVLLHAKEKAGIERAQLSVAFVRDRFAQGQRLSVASLIAAQSTYLHVFSATAPQAGEAALRQALASPVAAEVQRMESVVFLDGEGDFGIDASTWFQTISRKIDMLGDVSTTVLGTLRDQS